MLIIIKFTEITCIILKYSVLLRCSYFLVIRTPYVDYDIGEKYYKGGI